MKCNDKQFFKDQVEEDFQLLPGQGYEASVPLPLAESWAGEQHSTLPRIYHNQDVSGVCLHCTQPWYRAPLVLIHSPVCSFTLWTEGKEPTTSFSWDFCVK